MRFRLNLLLAAPPLTLKISGETTLNGMMSLSATEGVF